MAACLAGLFAVPAARSTFALALPPGSVLLAEAAVVLIAICARRCGRRARASRSSEPAGQNGLRPAVTGGA